MLVPMLPRPSFASALGSLLLLISGCAGPAQLMPRSAFEHELGREHPLTGRIWSRARHDFVAPRELYAELDRAQIVLLGETHDNIDHHRLQARLLERWLSRHTRASIAFEMLDDSQAAGLSAPAPSSAAELRQRVQWDRHGWPAFELYEPVFETALRHGAQLVPAQPAREHLVAVMRGEASGDEPSLRLTPALPEAMQQEMAREIREAHCGHAPAAMIAPMVRAQSLKDAWLARALVSAGAPAALIAGRGHVRGDRGVPAFLTRHAAANSLTVAFVDVDDARKSPADYEASVFDFVVFTPRVSDESACDRFKQQLERMRRKSP